MSTAKLEDARRRIVDWYKELGYDYVDVKYTLEPSPDNTRARVRFDVDRGRSGHRPRRSSSAASTTRARASSGGASRSRSGSRTARATSGRRRSASRRWASSRASRSALERAVRARRRARTSIIDVVERPGHYIELSPGFSTGEGVRGTLEYDERNIFGDAIGATFRAQLSYLPDFLILDPQVEANYQQRRRTASPARITLSGAFPEIGLGPLVRAQVDAVYVRDLERDFTLDKVSGIGTLIYRPAAEFQVSLGPERRGQRRPPLPVQLGRRTTSTCNPSSNGVNSALASLLRVPDGESFVVAQRAQRHVGPARQRVQRAPRHVRVLGAELVNSTPEGAASQAEHATADSADACSDPDERPPDPTPAPQAAAHFVRLTQTFAGYIPISQERLVRRRAAPRRERQDGVVPVHDPDRPREPAAALLHVPRPPVLHGRLRLDARLAAGHVHAAGATRTRSRRTPLLCHELEHQLPHRRSAAAT